MNYGYMIIYQKGNGDLLYRAMKHKPQYSKGSTTQYGWKVVDIQRLYNGKTYSYNDYNTLLIRRKNIHNVLSIINIENIKKLLYIISIIYVVYSIVAKNLFF